MSENRNIKKIIKEDWLNNFTELSVYTSNKFYEVIGCFIVGIEIINIPFIEGYRPYFVMYPLWRNSVKKCLDIPFLMISLNDQDGLQFDIPYLKHDIYLNDAVTCFKRQIPFSLKNNMTLDALYKFGEERLKNEPLLKLVPTQQVKILELEYGAALYTNTKSLTEFTVNQIRERSKDWNMQMFETWYGKFDVWFANLQDMQERRDEFLQQIETNKQDKKIKKLNFFELI